MTGDGTTSFGTALASGEGGPAASLRRDTVLTIALCDAWFERGADGFDRLLVGVDRPGAIDGFRINLAGGALVFHHLGDIKGRRVFEASAWHPADDSALSSRGPLFRLSGPFQRGPRDVA